MKLNLIIKLLKDPFFIIYSLIFSLVFFVFLFLIIDSFTQNKTDFEYDNYIKIEDNLNSSSKDEVLSKTWIVKENKLQFDEEKLENQKEKYDKIIEDLKLKIKQKELELSNNNNNVIFQYIPYYLENETLSNSWIIAIKETLFWSFFKEKNLNFTLELNEEKSNIRWKFIDNTIKLFWINHLNETELFSVFIHELWHYFDVIYLEKKVLFDLSDRFYDISWNWVNILREWSLKNDFVSGYAMTNKYEDFAESFIYYVFFNNDFRQKASLNTILQQKYDFFWKYIFRNDEFKKTNFRTQELSEDFYRDITKIEISLQNFLEYLKNWV